MPFKILSKTELKRRITSIGKTTAKLKINAHEAAQNCVLHVALHRNNACVNQLCDHMKDAAHNNAMSHWFNEYGKGVITWSAKEKIFKVNKEGCDILQDDAEAMDNLKTTLAESKPYYEMVKPPEYKPFILLKEIERIYTKANKKAAEGLEDEDSIEGLDALAAFIEKNHAKAA